jgi:hypothetical protein
MAIKGNVWRKVWDKVFNFASTIYLMVPVTNCVLGKLMQPLNYKEEGCNLGHSKIKLSYSCTTMIQSSW